MGRRSTSLNNYTGTAITREIDSKYDVIKEVSNHLDSIEVVANEDLQALTDALNEAQDFTGITVVVGETASWDPVNKILTVTTEKGDTGEQGIQGETGPAGPIGPQGIQGIPGIDGEDGETGDNGKDGYTPTVELSYNAVTGDLEYEIKYLNTIYVPEPDEEW